MVISALKAALGKAGAAWQSVGHTDVVCIVAIG